MTMENITNNYEQNSEGHLQYPSEQKDGLDLSMLALDLSCKKNVTIVIPEVVKESLNFFYTLPANAKQYQDKYLNLSERDGQTSIAGSSTMLSPYSESNSPKRMKLDESVGYYENSSQLKDNATLTNVRDITPAVTMAIPQQPLLPVLPNEVTKISVETLTMPIPCTETSQPFMTLNEAERKILLTVPTECSTSTNARLTASTSSLNAIRKASRPFKAYPKNFLSIVSTLDHNSNERFVKFREVMLENVKKMHANTPNPKMRRTSKSPALPTSTDDEKNAQYREKRRKNNEAAKRSREARRAKEDELAVRAAFLEYENTELRRKLEELQIMYNNLSSMLNLS